MTKKSALKFIISHGHVRVGHVEILWIIFRWIGPQNLQICPFMSHFQSINSIHNKAENASQPVIQAFFKKKRTEMDKNILPISVNTIFQAL